MQRTLLRVSSVFLAAVLLGGNGLFAADRGKSRDSGEAQWYADPERGWVRSDERRERKKEEHRESPKDRRSNQKDRDKGKNRGGSDY
jgi:hypothetical protein